MENDNKSKNAEQPQELDVQENESLCAFINTMVRIVEKYGKTVLQDLERAA